MESHYNPVIFQRLQTLAASRDWQGFPVYIDALSHAQFRTAGYIVAERILPRMADEADVWELVITLAAHNPRAFLVTMLKAVADGLGKQSLHLRSKGSRAFLAQVRQHPIDVQKTLAQLLPVLTSPDDVLWLFRKLDVEEGRARLPHLARVATMSASYALFLTLRYVEHDRALLVRVAHFLMKRGDGLAFNLASLIRAYYGLEEVKGTFALHIEPYQLARLASSYDAFCQAMRH